jgi:hypothetical protein
MPTIMRAVVVDALGPPEALQLRDIPIPTPIDGQVRIEVKVFGLNRSELLTRLGTTEPYRSAGAAIRRRQARCPVAACGAPACAIRLAGLRRPTCIANDDSGSPGSANRRSALPKTRATSPSTSTERSRSVCPTMAMLRIAWINSSLPEVVPWLELWTNRSSISLRGAASSRLTSAAMYSPSADRTRCSSVNC